MVIPAALAWILILAGIWSLIFGSSLLVRAWRDPKSKDDAGNLTRSFTLQFMQTTTSMILGIATAVIGLRGLAG